MAVSERARHELYEWLREEMGVDNADTFMALVPPTGWGDVPNRHDFESFQSEIRHDFEGFTSEVGHDLESTELRLRADMADRFRSQTVTLTTVFVGVMGLSVALNQLLG